MISSELPEVLGMADRDPRDARGPDHRRDRRREAATQEQVLELAMK